MKVGDGWQLFDVALVGQHGSEVDQGVDSLDMKVVTNDAGEFLWITYSDHAYEHYYEWDELEDLRERHEVSSGDSEGVIICRRAPQPVCTSPILTKLEYFGDDDVTYAAELSLEGDQIVVADVKTTGPVEYRNREDMWEFAGPLKAGKYPFPN